MTRARFRIGAALAVPAALTLVSCAPLVNVEETTAEQRFIVETPVRNGGEAVVALSDEPDRLDPTLARTLVGRTVFASFCEKLYDTNAELEVVPQLAAELPEVSDDGRTVTIRLREDLLFNDGTPMDAAAVKTSLDRHRTLEASARSTELGPVESVAVLDPLAVEIQLSTPFAPLASVLADRAGMIMSPQQLEALGEDFGNEPVCVGPFSFVERVAQDRIVVEKSEHYYGRDAVHLDRVIWRAIPDANIRMANLRSGDVDVIEEVAPTDVPALERDDELVLLSSSSIGYQGITVNVLNANGISGEKEQVPGALAADPQVRHAFSYAIDRETLNRIVFNGLYESACGPIPPTSEFATEVTQECPPYDPDQARQMLAEAGVDTPVPVELTVSTDPAASRLGQVVQAMASEAGFDVRLRPTEFASALDEADTGNFQTFQVGWSGRVDPDGNIANFHTEAGPLNYSGISDPETDDLIAQARQEGDLSARRAIYEQVVTNIQERQNIIYLYRLRLYTGHAAGLAGVTVYPDGLIRMTNAGYVAEGQEG